MLSEVLKIMDLEQSLAVTEIAKKLGWTLQRVENTIEQLESMGYIRKREIVSSSCKAGGCSGCPGCSFGKESFCQSSPNPTKILYSWVITDRGKNALH
ncbi:FeoC-like transcriptional regulator [Desulfitobacterium sp.]|uniref:FeoC-like transcriptional regulator n=1 Tax=Desulfitobacterium sp. TaxID=49981 RepID=UPI002B21251E|nr:FeoC-like transcriptional regulator [Desulfitobacterium sp.]MEA4901219.1 FeoC-like transcriptional regulator [Desulfitobacterium sp.]